MKGKIVKGISGFYYVHVAETGIYECKAKGIFRNQKIKPLVGDNVTITDTFNPVLRNISVTYNGNAWTETTNYTYNETTGAFATVAGLITVPAATFAQNAATGVITTTPGTAVVTVTGNI